MKYIAQGFKKGEWIHCNHPLISKIWVSGSLPEIPTNSPMKFNIKLEKNDGDVVAFSDYDWEKAIATAEKYLSELKP